jgi:RNA recognition motif-containing protein
VATKLYVCNLPHSVTDHQLKEFFTKAGFQVTSASVVRDKLAGTPWGFGFVDLREDEDAGGAITWLNGPTLEGNTLTVIAAMPHGMGFARSSNDSGQGGRRVGDTAIN